MTLFFFFNDVCTDYQFQVKKKVSIRYIYILLKVAKLNSIYEIRFQIGKVSMQKIR